MSTTATAMASVNNGPLVPAEFSIEVERIGTHLARKVSPDMVWEYVDCAGHWHAYDKDGKHPTLDARSEHVECNGGCGDDVCEGYDIPVYHCSICGEEIEPAVVVESPGPVEYVTGRMTWTVQVRQFVSEPRVSVRVLFDGKVFFGVAERVQSSGETVGGEAFGSATLVGAGPLGERQAKREAAVA